MSEVMNWVMEWHWGWQVFWGLFILGLVSNIVQWFQTGSDSMVMDIKIWTMEAVAWTLNLLANIIAYVGVAVMMFIFISAIAEHAGA